MVKYEEENKLEDFNFFIKNYQELFKQYGYAFLAIRNKKILGAYNSIPEAINTLSDKYKLGEYIIQKCTGDESAYETKIMRLIIKG